MGIERPHPLLVVRTLSSSTGPLQAEFRSSLPMRAVLHFCPFGDRMLLSLNAYSRLNPLAKTALKF